jgi:hypothetical protein
MWGRSSTFPKKLNPPAGLRPRFPMDKFQVSRDSQALYITLVAKDRLPVFRSDALKKVFCDALNEARNSGGLLIFAYVIMTIFT